MEPDPVLGLKEKQGKKTAEEGYEKFYSYRHPAGGWAELRLLKPRQSSASWPLAPSLRAWCRRGLCPHPAWASWRTLWPLEREASRTSGTLRGDIEFLNPYCVRQLAVVHLVELGTLLLLYW